MCVQSLSLPVKLDTKAAVHWRPVFLVLLECTCNIGQMCAFCVLVLILLLHPFRSCLLRTGVRPLIKASDAVPFVVVDAELRTVVLSLRNYRRLG